MKLIEKDKKEIYQLRQSGSTLTDLARQFNIRLERIKYLVRLIDIHGLNITEKRYRKYSTAFKEEAINRVLLSGERLNSVALDCGLSSAGMLHNWVRIYQENGYNVLNKKRGRPLMSMRKTTLKSKDTKESKLEKLEKENEYLRAEIAFLKKWNAVVQQEEKLKKKK